MCRNCFISGFAGFPSYWEFEAFEAELQQKLAQQLLPLPTPAPMLAAMACGQLYQCPVCGETWELSSPDNAWRGYFLPVLQAAAYRHRLQRNDRSRRLGCVGLLLALAGIILWRLLS